MEVYGPKEIARDGKPTGLWHYCYSNSASIWPIGYCAEGCPGHNSPEEAESHYHEYVLNNEVRRFTVPDTQQKCVICGDWTHHRAQIGRHHAHCFVLCQAHNTPETIRKLYLDAETPVICRFCKSWRQDHLTIGRCLNAQVEAGTTFADEGRNCIHFERREVTA